MGVGLVGVAGWIVGVDIGVAVVGIGCMGFGEVVGY